jgi:hypothetical protein
MRRKTAMPETKLLKDPLFWASFLIGGFFLSLCLWFSLGMDQSLYCYSAWVWKKYHLLPYIGVWEHNFPGIFLLHRVELALFGDSVLGFRVFDFLVQLSCLPMIFYLAKRLSGSGIAGLLSTSFYGIYYFSLGNSGTGQRETFIFWIFLMCLAIAFSGQGLFRLRASAIGLLLGFVFLLKPTYGLSWPVFGVFFLATWMKQRPKKTAGDLLFFSFSCILPTLLFIFIYWRMDHLVQLYQEIIWYNSEIYSQMTDAQTQWRYFFVQDFPNFAFRDHPLIFFSALIAIGYQLKKRTLAKDQSLFWILFSLLIASLFSYAFQAKFFPYQMAPFMGFLIIFSGFAFGQAAFMLKDLTRSVPGKAALWAACVILIILTVANTDPWLRGFALRYCFRDFDRAYLAGAGTVHDTQLSANYFQVARFLKPLVKPNDQIACFGPYPLLPFLLKTKLVTTFPCVQYLLRMRENGQVPELQKKWIEEYSGQIVSARPRFIVISDSFPGWNNAFFNYTESDLAKALELQFPQLKKFIANNYNLTAAIGHVSIYEIMPVDK